MEKNLCRDFKKKELILESCDSENSETKNEINEKTLMKADKNQKKNKALLNKPKTFIKNQ
jgi:hypothetical protein